MEEPRRTRGGMSEQRRRRLRLEISREAARLFWERGVSATGGEQIADAVGLSVRTIWRHFRTKESCAEPIVTRGVEWFMAAIRSWPDSLSLEEHLAARTAAQARESRPGELADELLAIRMIALTETEPALRTVWLTACDRVEGEIRALLAVRLDRPVEHLDVRLHAAAAAAVVRVLDEHVGSAVLAGATLGESRNLRALSARFADAIRQATGGAVGDPVERREPASEPESEGAAGRAEKKDPAAPGPVGRMSPRL